MAKQPRSGVAKTIGSMPERSIYRANASNGDVEIVKPHLVRVAQSRAALTPPSCAA
jgi:hypothetical protein